MARPKTDFDKFTVAYFEYRQMLERNDVDEYSKNYDSFYEKIRDLDCYDFRLFYFKSHFMYKKLQKIDVAKELIDKSITAFLSAKNSTTNEENSIYIYVTCENHRSFPIKENKYEIPSKMYALAGELYSIKQQDAIALDFYKRSNYYKTLLYNEIEKEEYISLYTFRRFNEFSLSDLINNEITVCSSKKMNDPFDSIVNLWGCKEILKNNCTEQQHIDNLSKSLEYFRIRSFCNGVNEKNLEKIIMWSHYADEHRGFCIKYKLSKHFIKQERNDSFEHMFLKPIVYKREKVDISGMKSLNTDLAFATKNCSWIEEDEIRLIVYNPNKEEDFYGIPLDEGSSIEAIYFGCRCSPNTIKTIKNIFSNTGLHPKFFMMYSEYNDVYQLCWREI